MKKKEKRFRVNKTRLDGFDDYKNFKIVKEKLDKMGIVIAENKENLKHQYTKYLFPESVVVTYATTQYYTAECFVVIEYHEYVHDPIPGTVNSILSELKDYME